MHPAILSDELETRFQVVWFTYTETTHALTRLLTNTLIGRLVDDGFRRSQMHVQMDEDIFPF
jgi:hypothetical protein